MFKLQDRIVESSSAEILEEIESFAVAKLLEDSEVFAVESSFPTFKFASKRLSKVSMPSSLEVPLFPSSRQSVSAARGTPETIDSSVELFGSRFSLEDRVDLVSDRADRLVDIDNPN